MDQIIFKDNKGKEKMRIEGDELIHDHSRINQVLLDQLSDEELVDLYVKRQLPLHKLTERAKELLNESDKG